MSDHIHVLLVEDDSDQAHLTQKLLEKEGYQVSVVGTGARAVDETETRDPDLILMDIGLAGGMDGVEAAVLVRKRTGKPVVFLTAHADAKTLERAREAEPYGYLIKPVDPQYFRPTVEMALHKYRMERERQELTQRLREALSEVEQLRGLLPVCAWCRRVRDDAGYWDSLEGYLSRRLSTAYSHGICADCMQEHFPDQEPGKKS